MEQEKIKSIIESILFLSGEPVKIQKIAKMIDVKKEEVENAMMILRGEYSKKGIVIIEKGDEVQMVTNPDNATFTEKLIKGELQESLSNAALEVLSIIAYKGPISKVNIESIRGVNCSYTLRGLLMRGLIEKENNPNDSRGYLYVISFDFLKNLGIENVNKLPDFESLSSDGRLENVIKQDSDEESIKKDNLDQ